MKTKNTLNTLITAAAIFAAIGLHAESITIDTVLVGNAGNAADTGGTVGAGAVAYDYHIGTTEVTAGQYVAFLNAVASTSDKFGLYNTNMFTHVEGCGIQQIDNGNGTFSYEATKGDNMPVNFVSVYNAMRFCNWVTTGNTEIGVYVLNNTATGVALVTRDNDAWLAGGVAIASLDEWYKAAFYNGDTETYSRYANGTNTAPKGTEANFNGSVFGTITDVDFGVTSFYGTFGQNGNVWEWTDTVVGTGNHIYIRGGAFNGPTSYMVASYNNTATATDEYRNIGFRVSSLTPIPEPSTYAAIFGALALAFAAYRKRSYAPKK